MMGRNLAIRMSLSHNLQTPRTSYATQISRTLAKWVAILVALIVAAEAGAANLTASWKINGEGYVGDLIINQAPSGELTGSIYGEPMRGYHATQTSDVVLLRGPASNPTQAFVGTLNFNSNKITGTYYELTPGALGANSYRFAATRATTTAPSLPYVFGSVFGPGPSAITGSHTVFNRPAEFGRSWQGSLVFNQTGTGYLTGSIFGEALVGHYAVPRAGVVFLRMRNNLPLQLYLGQVDGASPLQVRGIFYALSSGAGASATTMRYDWATVVPKAADITANWKINASGVLGDLNLNHAANGALSGLAFGASVQGFYSPKERIAVFLAGPAAKPDFAYVGRVSEDGESMVGDKYTLNMALAGTYARNVFPFAARRAPNSHPTTLPGQRAEVSPIPADGFYYPIFNRPAEFGLTQRGLLSFSVEHFYPPQQPDSSLDGTLTGYVWGDVMYGHYAIGTGTIVFVRMRDNLPFQLYVGDVLPYDFQARGFQGEFYALTAGAGASAQRVKYDWLADWTLQ